MVYLSPCPSNAVNMPASARGGSKLVLPCLPGGSEKMESGKSPKAKPRGERFQNRG